MIIEDETKAPMCAISVWFDSESVVTQGHDTIIIDKHQAAQLIEALQRWVDGEEIK
jgi:hypothetical protein|nr:MAG TPA: hypothetical protein [Caudoviricetes sp.]